MSYPVISRSIFLFRLSFAYLGPGIALISLLILISLLFIFKERVLRSLWVYERVSLILTVFLQLTLLFTCDDPLPFKSLITWLLPAFKVLNPICDDSSVESAELPQRK